MRKLDLVGATRFYQASTSELFGDADRQPLSEASPFHPINPYAVSKHAAFEAAVNFREAYGLFACNGILFNHESPYRGSEFVTRKITRAVAAIDLGLETSLRLGNLDTCRDWGHARDYVEGMWLMLQRDKPDDYVMATNDTHTVREFADLAFQEIGMPLQWEGEGEIEKGIDSEGNVRVAVDPNYYRPTEVDLLIGDYSKAKRDLGWEPRVRFEELVKIMVRADLEKVGKRGF